MATIDFDTLGAQAPAKPIRPRLHFLRRLLARFRRNRRAKQTYLALSQLDAWLLRDIGIDPADVWDALNNRPGQSLLLHPMRQQFDFDAARRRHLPDAGWTRPAPSNYRGEPVLPTPLTKPATAGGTRT